VNEAIVIASMIIGCFIFGIVLMLVSVEH